MSMSGFTGYQVIQSLKRAYPNLANQLTQLQVAGYTAKQIAGALGRGNGKYVPTEEMFDTQTEHEKSEEYQSRNKSKAGKEAAAIIGTGLAVGGGLSLAAFRALRASQPIATTLLTGRGGAQAGQLARGTTLNQVPKALPFNPGQVAGRSPKQLPNIPPPAPSHRGQPTLGAPNAPKGIPHIQPDYAQSVHIIDATGQAPLLRRVIDQGLDLPTTVALMQTLIKGDRQTASRGVLDLFKKAPGGIEKIVSDYAQFLQQEKQQQASMPKEQTDERVQFQEPPQSIRMKGPPPQAPSPVQQAFNEASQQEQIAPGRQRLMGLMAGLKEARGAGNAPSQVAAPPEPNALEQIQANPVGQSVPTILSKSNKEKIVSKNSPKLSEKSKRPQVSQSILSSHERKIAKAKDELEFLKDNLQYIVNKKYIPAQNKRIEEKEEEIKALESPEKKKELIHKISDVQDKIDKVNQHDISPKGLKDQKKYLLDHIRKAIENPPEGKTIKIDIPGDGAFNFINDKKVLEAALKKVEKNWPESSKHEAPEKKHKAIPRNPNIMKELDVTHKIKPTKEILNKFSSLNKNVEVYKNKLNALENEIEELRNEYIYVGRKKGNDSTQSFEASIKLEKSRDKQEKIKEEYLEYLSDLNSLKRKYDLQF